MRYNDKQEGKNIIIRRGVYMGYQAKAKKVAERYNNKDGTIVDLLKEVGIGRTAFYSNIKKMGIVKDDDLDKYIIPSGNIGGQIDILEVAEGVVRSEETKEMDNITSVEDETTEGNERVSGVAKEDIEVTEEIKAENQSRKKKTFEIDIDLEQLIRVRAAILDISINDYVNIVLRESIPDTIKNIIS